MNPDLSALAAYGGDYSQQLMKKLYHQLNVEAAGLSVYPGLKSKVNLHKILIQKGLKPYTGAFKSKNGDVSYEPRELSVEKAQRDLSIEPSKYIGTFMEKNRGMGENAQNSTIPFAQVVWETVLEEVAHEIVVDTVYNGIGKAGFAAWASGSTYSAGAHVTFTQDGELRYFVATASTAAGESPTTHPAKWAWAGGRALAKGFKKIIDDEVAASKIPASRVVSTGAITSTDAYGQFINVWRALPEIQRMRGGTIYCSVSSYERLLDDMENKVHKNFEVLNNMTFLSKTDRKARILPVNWLSGSGKLIASADANLWMGTDQTSDMNSLKIMEQMYHIDAGLTFMLGFQIADLDVVAVNDQA